MKQREWSKRTKKKFINYCLVYMRTREDKPHEFICHLFDNFVNDRQARDCPLTFANGPTLVEIKHSFPELHKSIVNGQRRLQSPAAWNDNRKRRLYLERLKKTLI